MIAYNVPEYSCVSFSEEIISVNQMILANDNSKKTNSDSEDSENTDGNSNKIEYQSGNGGYVVSESTPEKSDIQVDFPDEEKADLNIQGKIYGFTSAATDLMDKTINQDETVKSFENSTKAVLRNIFMTIIVGVILAVFYFTLKKDD